MYRHLSVLVLALAAGCAATTLRPFNIRFQYETTADPVEFPLLQACSAVSSVEVTDARTNPQLGTRFLERNPDEKYQVTTASDVAAWARSGVEEGLRRARVEMGKASGPILEIAVENIATGESVYRRAEYDGRVVLVSALRRSKGEQPCWQERVDGAAKNYGYAGSNENYLETVNHALDRAVIRMLNSASFKEAVCSCVPPK